MGIICGGRLSYEEAGIAFLGSERTLSINSKIDLESRRLLKTSLKTLTTSMHSSGRYPSSDSLARSSTCPNQHKAFSG